MSGVGPAARRTAALWLGIACLGWGWSFPALKLALDSLDLHVDGATPWAGVTTLCGWRFALAALLYFLCTARTQHSYSRADLHGGLVCGVTFTAGLFLQTLALRYVTPAIAAFLTALYVVWTPLAQKVLLRRPLPRLIWPAVALALAGMLMLGWSQADGDGRDAPFPFCGEALTILATFLFTAQILCLDRFGREAHPARLTTVMFVTAALLGLFAGVLAPGGALFYEAEPFAALWCDWTFQWTLVSMVVFSSVFAFHVMNTYQPRLSPAVAGVIYAFEPVCAAAFSALMGTERLTWGIFAGGGPILAAALLVVYTETANDRLEQRKA